MDIKITKTRDGLAGLSKALADLTSKRVLVGVPAETTKRDDGEPINNATLAYIHNYGSPAANIPARPFLEPGIKNAQDSITANFKKAALSALNGDARAVEASLMQAGEDAAEAAQTIIEDGDLAPLAPATIAQRLREGFKGDKPLQRTREMLRSIKSVIRDK